MTLRPVFLSFIAAAGLAATLAAPAAAATVNEAEYGAFSGSWTSPTVLSGADSVSGSGRQNEDDFLYLTGLQSGAQTLSFTFSGPNGSTTYNGGGDLRYSFDQFRWDYDGIGVGTFNVANGQTALSIALDDSFDGSIYLQFAFNWGDNTQYSFATSKPLVSTAPSTGGSAIVSAAVPLPAGFALLGSVLAGGGLLAAARRRKARTA